MSHQNSRIIMHPVGWEINDPFRTKIDYIRDKALGGGLVLSG